MTPLRRRMLYAISFESLGILVAAVSLRLMSNASTSDSLALAVIGASLALAWSFVFNAGFEAWEARQSVKGRSLRRRAAHALLFEGGLTVLLVPVMAWWLDTGLLQALAYEATLIAVFIAYTYLFTWGFDLLFGLPESARPSARPTASLL